MASPHHSKGECVPELAGANKTARASSGARDGIVARLWPTAHEEHRLSCGGICEVVRQGALLGRSGLLHACVHGGRQPRPSFVCVSCQTAQIETTNAVSSLGAVCLGPGGWQPAACPWQSSSAALVACCLLEAKGPPLPAASLWGAPIGLGWVDCHNAVPAPALDPQPSAKRRCAAILLPEQASQIQTTRIGRHP